MELKNLAVGFLTGFGFTHEIRPEFADFSNFADTEKLGALDAPDRIAAGSLVGGGISSCQQVTWRP